MKNVIYSIAFLIVVAGCSQDPVVNKEYETFEDARDKQVYNWVQIGDQVWMAENLAYLPAVNPVTVFSATEPYYYVYGYAGSIVGEAQSNSNYKAYGVLYNWVAAQTACPPGWHLPGDEEWKRLEENLGMSQIEVNSSAFRESGSVGKKLKTLTGWDSNGAGDNSSGFSVLPGGYRSYNGSFEGAGLGAGFWSATENGLSIAWYRGLGFFNSGVERSDYAKSDGFSVRCIRNQAY